MHRVPKRLEWAVDSLPIRGSERVPEIGCGRGAALALICGRLTSGQVTGLDRSAGAIAAAGARNQACIASGRVRLVHSALADASLGGGFDLAFAVNVNVFWLAPARELAMLDELLKPRGRLWLFYQPPSAAKAQHVTERCQRALKDGGFDVIVSETVELEPHRASGSRTGSLAVGMARAYRR